MSTLQHRAEMQRLARLLGPHTAGLTYLEAVDLATLKQLRERSTAMLYDADREALQRIANAARLLPSAIAALIAEKALGRSEEHTSELQSLMRISYAVFCLKKKKNQTTKQ